MIYLYIITKWLRWTYDDDNSRSEHWVAPIRVHVCVHLSKTPKELMEQGSLNHPGVDGATEGCRSMKVSCLAFYSCYNLELTDTVPESWGPYSSKTMLGQYYLWRFCGISKRKLSHVNITTVTILDLGSQPKSFVGNPRLLLGPRVV